LNLVKASDNNIEEGSMMERNKKTGICICLLFFQMFFLVSGCLFAIDIKLENQGAYQVQNKIVSEARKYLGTPYVSGGISKSGVDCSGLVYRIFHDAANVELSRMVTELKVSGEKVVGSLFPADLLFFDTEGKGSATHVAISIGDKKFIHAASAGSKTGVIISSLEENYYAPKYLGACRLVNLKFPVVNVMFNDKNRKEIKFENTLTEGLPLFVNMSSTLPAGLLLSLKIYKNNDLVVSKRIKLSPKELIAQQWFIPDNGEWSVKIEDIKSNELAFVRF
jgi:hypothetical protein